MSTTAKDFSLPDDPSEVNDAGPSHAGSSGGKAVGYRGAAGMTVQAPKQTDLQQSYAAIVADDSNPKGWYGSMSALDSFLLQSLVVSRIKRALTLGTQQSMASAPSSVPWAPSPAASAARTPTRACRRATSAS